MTLAQLRCFATIVDCGHNVTMAARQLHATQSGLSKQLAQLEGSLGFLLFTRRARTLTSLTAAGEQVLVHARRLLAEADNIRTLADNLRHESQGQLRIATTHTQARYALPGPLGELKRAFPDVALHVAPGGDAESLAQLDRGDADIVILSRTDAPSGAFLAIPLYRWRRRILVPRGHALARLDRPLCLADLSGVPLVSYESSREPESSLQLAFAARGLKAEVVVTARDGDLIRTYVRSGLGVGVLAEMALIGNDADLVAPRIDADLLPPCTTWLLMRRDQVLRDYGFSLLHSLLPHVTAIDLRRALDQSVPPPVAVPDWQNWLSSIGPHPTPRTAASGAGRAA